MSGPDDVNTPARSILHLDADAFYASVEQAADSRLRGKAIAVGGTTLRDYVGADGNPGYFRQKLFVYERMDEPCRKCGTPVRQRVQGQRSTYWCPSCQR